MTLLIISQVYVPDPASVGQHMHDAAAEMVRRGMRVVVITSSRGYDDPSVGYPARETRDGVEIHRVSLSSFGKRSIKLRLLAGTLFMLQAMLRGMWTRGLSGVLVSTSPPMCAVAAIVVGMLRRVPVKYWVMDLNPDQMIELGKLSPTSRSARAFDALNRLILKRAADVVVLDRFMADRVKKKRDVSSKLHILPPWPHEDHLEPIAHADNPFRRDHGLEDRFVIMYSGNHGFSTPITTVLQAALRLQDVDRLLFMFIGGGVGKAEVDEAIEKHRPPNIRSLPYQPLDQIKYSLSAADVHLVTVGDRVVGVVHPCKIYGAMVVGRPVLLVSPEASHASDLVEPRGIGWHLKHGDIDTATNTIRKILETDTNTLHEMGDRARALAQQRFSRSTLLGAFADVLQRGVRPD